MKNANTKRRTRFFTTWAAVTVLAASLLLTACPHKPKDDPKPQKGIPYTVEHWQQNIENDEYTLKETEKISGKAGENTAATVKTYEGFTAKTVTQQKIKADGSTVVQVKYDRNIITLKLNLNGGTTNPELEDGADGTKILKGKFGAKVKLENLGKTGTVLEKWTPPLPETFPASSPAETYTASWLDGYIVTIKGDERTKIAENTFIKANRNPIKTWNEIAVQVKAKVNLKIEWQGGDYEVYEWRLGDENGQKLTDDYRIDKHITVYAVTNYNKFNIDSTGTKIEIRSDKGYTGEKPKGKIIIPDGITEIADGTDWYKGAFSNCAEITSVKFPQGLTKIGSSAFLKCTDLTSINLSESLNQIGDYAFRECTGLTSINLPQSLNQIGDYAFRECTGLTSINLPQSLTQIGSEAFALCTGLTSINLPAGLTQIGMGIFAGCTGLTRLTVDSGNAVYKAEHNIVYTKDGKTLVCAAGGLTSATILDTVTAIGEGAFAYCTGLTSIDLSGLASLNQIGGYAFYSCTGLTSINLPASLTQIGLEAFSECTGLKSAVFEDKTGWTVYDNYTYTGTSTPVNLDDASTAAKYLREVTGNGGYSDKYWKKR